jgi:hypothetical protein
MSPINQYVPVVLEIKHIQTGISIKKEKYT